MITTQQETTYVATPSLGSTGVNYEFTVTPDIGFTVNNNFAPKNTLSNTNPTIKLTFTVEGTYTVKVRARNSCTTAIREATIVETVTNNVTTTTPVTTTIPVTTTQTVINNQNGFRYLTPATRRFQFGNEDGIKFLNQDSTVDKSQMRIVYDSNTNTITDLDWNVSNYPLPKAWRFNTEPFKTTPLQNIVIPTTMYNKPITVELHYYDNNPQIFRYYDFKQDFIIYS